MQIWSIAGAHETPRLDADDIMSVAFSPDRTMVGSREADGSTIRLWDAASGWALQRLDGLEKYTGALAFSPDGRTVAAGAFAVLKFRERNEGKIGNPAASLCYSLRVYSPDGTAIATIP